MENFLYLLSAGLGVGCIYGIVALGLSMVYETTYALNFAQGEFLMLGAVSGWFFMLRLDIPYGWSALLAIVGTVIVATIALNWGMLSPLLKKNTPHMALVLSLYAVGSLISAIAGKLTDYRYLRVPSILPMNSMIRLGAFPIVGQYGLIMLVTVVVVGACWFFLKYTHIGWAYRAVGLDRDMAESLGISVGGMVTLGVAIAAAVGAVAGLIAGPLTSVSATMGMNYLLKGFIGGIVGGMGNPLTAVAGGVLLGVMYMLVGGYLSSGYAELITFVFFVFVLITRPHGIFTLK